MNNKKEEMSKKKKGCLTVSILAIITFTIILIVSIIVRPDNVNLSSSKVQGTNTSTVTSNSKKVYSDSIIDVTFDKAFNQEGIIGELYLGLTVKNKSSKNITVSLTDVCIDDSMMQVGSGVPLTILPGKSGSNSFFGKNSTDPKKIKSIGFKIYLMDNSGKHLETTKQIDVKLN